MKLCSSGYQSLIILLITTLFIENTDTILQYPYYSYPTPISSCNLDFFPLGVKEWRPYLLLNTEIEHNHAIEQCYNVLLQNVIQNIMQTERFNLIRITKNSHKKGQSILTQWGFHSFSQNTMVLQPCSTLEIFQLHFSGGNFTRLGFFQKSARNKCFKIHRIGVAVVSQQVDSFYIPKCRIAHFPPPHGRRTLSHSGFGMCFWAVVQKAEKKKTREKGGLHVGLGPGEAHLPKEGRHSLLNKVAPLVHQNNSKAQGRRGGLVNVIYQQQQVGCGSNVATLF